MKPPVQIGRSKCIPFTGGLRAALLAHAILMLMVVAFDSPVHASPAEALRAYQGGKYKDARKEYERLAQAAPDDPRFRFNAGATAYRQQDWTNAAAWFETVLGNPDIDLQQKANYNLGNTRFRLGEAMTDPQAKMKEWEQSIGHFEAATRLNAADSNAVQNLNFAREQLEELRRQQPPPPKGGKDDKKKQPPKDSHDDQQQTGSDSQSDDSKQEQQKDQQNQKAQAGDSQKQQKPDGKQGEKQPKPEVAPNSSGKPDSDGSKEDGKHGEKPDGKQGQASASDSQKSGKPNVGEKGEKKDGDASGAGAETAESGADESTPPGEMSAVQASRLLDSQKGEEKALVFKSQGNGNEAKPNNRVIRRPW